MSYSRWGNSRWYTFWSASGAVSTTYKFPTEKLKRSQVFEICDIPSYHITYGDLVDTSRSKVLYDIEKLYPGVTWEELDELQLYFRRFMMDVDEHFQPWTFFKYEWLYPMRNKVIFKYRKLKRKYEQNRSK